MDTFKLLKVLNFEINDGIILLQEMLNAGLYEYSKFGENWLAGDTDLENAANITATTNATILEFDFVPNTNKISFDYMFLSEQYLKTNCGYTDGFAF
jgi:hypothetical protein